jgi:asparagine synthase (glutamine-hydrolysing)
MCGIVGMLRTQGPVQAHDQKLVEAMGVDLHHRGPDGDGQSTIGPCVLGHRRLAIIDLTNGQQPMSGSDNRVTVSFNGEIYNHKEIRADLEKHGYVFRTECDTEALIHLYEHKGLEMFQDLEGMYAFALWDAGKNRLVLARDPMGQKPLYWAQLKDRVVFSSEMRSILRAPDLPRNINTASVALYLRHDSIPAPWTIYENVHKVEPGHFVVLEGPDFEPNPCGFSPFPVDATAGFDLGPEEAKKRLWNTLVESVEQRLMSDVPLGLFLSGGVDSTVILAAMAECTTAKNIACFSIGFQDPSFDERGPAQMVAKHFGVQHQVRVLDPETSLHMVPTILNHLSEPFADPSIVPTWLLSEFTREHVTVALGGDGGDELFLGYPTFGLDRTARTLGRTPKWFRSGIPGAISRLLPRSSRNMSTQFKLQRFSSGMKLPWPHNHFVWITGMRPNCFDRVLRDGLAKSEATPDAPSFRALNRILEREEKRSVSREHLLSSLYSELYLSGCVLQKVDRASMANSLEVRAPFLGRAVVREAMGLPPSLRRSKKILRSILADLGLPASIYKRPKKGFGIPVAQWLRGPLKEYASELFTGQGVQQSTILDPGGVSQIWEAHLSGKADYRKELWSLLALRAWEQSPYGPHGGAH